MKKLVLAALTVMGACTASAQNCCSCDTVVIEPQFPLSERDTKTSFLYFNDEWLPDADVDADSILTAQVKKDQYRNRAMFMTVSPTYFARIKAQAGKCMKKLTPRCEFPGGDAKLQEWIKENMRIPEDFKGVENVEVAFIVNPDGTISSPRLLRPAKNEAANAEALRLVSALPRFRVKYFTPKKSVITYVLPLRFKEPGLILICGNNPFATEGTPKQNAGKD